MNARCAGKLWDSWRTRAIPERLRDVFTTRRYTNLRLPFTSITGSRSRVCRIICVKFNTAHVFRLISRSSRGQWSIICNRCCLWSYHIAGEQKCVYYYICAPASCAERSKYCFWQRLSVCPRKNFKKLLIKNWRELVWICVVLNARSDLIWVTFELLP